MQFAQALNGDDDFMPDMKMIDDATGHVAAFGPVHAFGIDENVGVECDPQS